MSDTYRGSCLCGEIVFEIDEFLPDAAHCHCTMCRKFHGAAYATYASVMADKFHWLQGVNALKVYTAKNNTKRTFCKYCGSSLVFASLRADGKEVEIALGTLDSDVPISPNAHIFADYGANWSVINDSLDCFKDGRESLDNKPVKSIETSRLTIRPFELTDAALIVTLLNEPTFIKNIADKGVRTIADAETYLRDGPLASYQQYGFGLCLVSLKDTQIPIGMCGLIQRDYLPMADIGYALFPQYCSRGYANEACSAMLNFARDQLKMSEVAAIVNRENVASIRLLAKLDFHFQKPIRIENENKEVQLYLASL